MMPHRKPSRHTFKRRRPFDYILPRALEGSPTSQCFHCWRPSTVLADRPAEADSIQTRRCGPWSKVAGEQLETLHKAGLLVPLYPRRSSRGCAA